MSLRSESPSPVDEDDPDSRVKRPRRTTLILGHTRPNKRKLPSCPQSPTEEDEGPADARRSLTSKRQRCTTLEHEIERLSLTPPSLPATAPTPAPEFATRLPAAGVLPDLRFSQWLDIPAAASSPAVAPSFQQSNLGPFPMMTPAASVRGTDALEDVKMRSSSWYEPEKDRIVVTDLDAESDDEDAVDDAPKLPRAVLQALLCDGVSTGLLPSSLVPSRPADTLPSPPTSPPQVTSFSASGLLDEAMDVEQ